MPVPSKIIKYLDLSRVKYERIEHKTVYTAYDKVATLKVKPNVIGKTLVLKIDNELAMVLIPGNKNLDKNKFKKVANDWRKKIEQKSVKNIDFISEKVMKNKFKGVKVGAVPPFGNLWKLPTFVDKSLMEQTKIVVNGGDYEWSIKISPSIFKKIIPDLIIGNFSQAKK